MRLIHIINQVFHKPWLITADSHAAIRKVVETKLDGIEKIKIEGDGVDMFGNPLPSMTVSDGVGVIPIHGVVGKGLGMLEKTCGMVDTNDIQNWIQQAEGDPSVKAVLFDFASPGGTVGGVLETADMIANMSKPTIGFTDDLSASASYWMMSACDTIYMTPTAEVGSIGVYLPVFDVSEAYEMQGVKVDIIKPDSNIFKAAGYEGTRLTDDQRNQLKSEVTYIYEKFSGFVSTMRPQIKPESMRGQVFIGEQALAAGLADAIVSKQQAIDDCYDLTEMESED